MQITAQLDDSYQTRIAAIQQSTQLDISEIIKQALDLLYEKTALTPKEKNIPRLMSLRGVGLITAKQKP